MMGMMMIWPLVVYGTAVFFLIAIMLTLSYVWGERHQGRARNEAFESGNGIGLGRLY